MKKKENYYISTTLPYVNARPHIGFAMEIVRTDVMARYQRLQGKEVFFNTGTDEHGQKIYQKAQEEGKDPQVYCDEWAAKFHELRDLLNLSYDNFVRTTDPHHVEAAQEFWRVCNKNGYIYKKNYKIKYCVGCELEKTDSELDNDRCPIHPNQEIELIEEENYFFKFSEFGEKLLAFYKEHPDFVQPEQRYREIISFVGRGLDDFSISRLKSKMPWGVEVPDDPDQVMYVWFDALVNYISAIGWPGDQEKFKKFWPVVQVCGKDNLRQQSAMWQAMLLAAGLPNSERIYINGFINVGGQKMSKSLGNVITPQEMVEKFGVDGTRYLLLTLGVFGEDWDVTWERMIEKYNADLANGLGNLVSRVVKLSQNMKLPDEELNSITNKYAEENLPHLQELIDSFFSKGQLEQILFTIWQGNRISSFNLGQETAKWEMEGLKHLDKFVEEKKPWELAKNDQAEFDRVMAILISRLHFLAGYLVPFMPDTAAKIKQALETREIQPLFQRIR